MKAFSILGIDGGGLRAGGARLLGIERGDQARLTRQPAIWRLSSAMASVSRASASRSCASRAWM